MPEPLHILLIDDKPVDRVAVRRALSDAQVETDVRESADATGAVELLRRERFDCVLLDHRLPERDGLAVLRDVRAAGITTPVIMMTAQGSEQLAVEMMKAGATDYLSKATVSVSRLEQSVRNAVRIDRAETEAKRAGEKLLEQTRVTETLYRIASMLAAERDLHTLVQVVTDEATALIEANFGAFFYNVVNDNGESYTLFTLSGASREPFSNFPMPRNTAIFGPTFRGEGVVRLDDVTADPRYGKNAPYRGMPPGHLPVRSYLAVPVLARSGEVLGGLFFAHAKTAMFSEEDEHLVAGIAAQAAVAIDNARLVEALRRGEEQYRFMAESVPQLMWTATPDGRPDYFNQRWVQYTGRTVGQSTVDGWKHTLHPQDLPRCVDRWQHSIISGELYEIEARLRRGADDSYRWFLVRALPMRDEQGRIARWFGTCTDIEDQKRAELDLSESRDAAEAANNAKDQFLAVLSHELRTPLMPVLTTVQTLEDEPGVTPDLRDSLEMIRRNVELEARLIDDLLDLTRIAKGKLQLNADTVDLHAAMQSALDICAVEIMQKHLRTSLDLSAANHHVHGDPARLQQVFWNLIKNAVKFTPAHGLISIRSDAAAGAGAGAGAGAAGDGEAVRIEIRDTGIGIEPAALSRIFDAFEQGGPAINRRFGGLGLGLAISKALIDLHHGKLQAASEGKGRGASFSIQLPTVPKTIIPPAAPSAAGSTTSAAVATVEPAPTPAPAAASPSTPLSASARTRATTGRGGEIKILLVDDHYDTNRAMQRLLQRLGYQVRTADSINAALAAADESAFDLLISDIGLPDGSGLELMRQLLSRRPARPIKGIALSGFGMEEDIQRSKDAGFYEHLTKPINFKRLESAIRHLTSNA
jgi:PAS domain S-box-containing protein